MTGRSHRSWGYFGILRALTGLGHLKWPPPTPAACSSACMPALSHAEGGLAPSPAPGLLLGSPGLTSMLRTYIPAGSCWSVLEGWVSAPEEGAASRRMGP